MTQSQRRIRRIGKVRSCRTWKVAYAEKIAQCRTYMEEWARILNPARSPRDEKDKEKENA